MEYHDHGRGRPCHLKTMTTTSELKLRRRDWIALAMILIGAAAVRLTVIDKPFLRDSEGLGAYYGVLARNYLRHNWTETWGVPIQSVGQWPGVEPTVYGHHPPLLPMLIAATYAVFGDGEWQTRLTSALFALGCSALLFILLRNRGRPRAGLFAALLFAALPMSIYYGGHPDVINPQLVFFILLTLAAYQHLHAQPTMKRLLLLCAAFLPAALTDWPAFFVVPVVCLHFAATRPVKAWSWIIAFGSFATLMFALEYAQIAMAMDDWRWMGEKVGKRTFSDANDQGIRFNWGRWWTVIFDHNRLRHTLPVMILAGAWLCGAMVRVRRPDEATRFVRLVFAFAVLHIFIGKQGVYNHDWWLWPVTVFVTLAAALALDEIVRYADRRLKELSGIVTLLPALVATLALIGFATWTCIVTLPKLEWFDSPARGYNYSTFEIGEAIRVAAPDANGIVLVAHAYDKGSRITSDVAIWYYGDRCIKLEIWDSYTMQQMIKEPTADLPFGFRQHCPPRADGFVLPKQWVTDVRGFAQHLDANYPKRETEKFLIYDLRQAPKTPSLD
jgi:4-amino-4-deoxy-L-arabinose transferase-like glycosyltransferase